MPLSDDEIKGILFRSTILFAYPKKDSFLPGLVMIADIDKKARRKLVMMKMWYLANNRDLKITRYRDEEIIMLPDIHSEKLTVVMLRNILLIGYGKVENEILLTIDAIKDNKVNNENIKYSSMLKDLDKKDSTAVTVWTDMSNLYPYIEKMIINKTSSLTNLQLITEYLKSTLNYTDSILLRIKFLEEKLEGEIISKVRIDARDKDIRMKDLNLFSEKEINEKLSIYNDKTVLFYYSMDQANSVYFDYFLKSFENDYKKKKACQQSTYGFVYNTDTFIFLKSFLKKISKNKLVHEIGDSFVFFIEEPYTDNDLLSKGFILKIEKPKKWNSLFEQMASEHPSFLYVLPDDHTFANLSKEKLSRPYVLSCIQENNLFLSNNLNTLKSSLINSENKNNISKRVNVEENEKGRLVSFFYLKPDILGEKIKNAINELMLVDENEEDEDLVRISNLLFLLKITGSLDSYIIDGITAFQEIEEIFIYRHINNDFTLNKKFVIMFKKDSVTN